MTEKQVVNALPNDYFVRLRAQALDTSKVGTDWNISMPRDEIIAICDYIERLKGGVMK